MSMGISGQPGQPRRRGPHPHHARPAVTRSLSLLLIAGVAVLAGLAIACGDDDSGGSATTSATPASPTPTPTYAPTPSGSVTLQNVCTANPDPATGDEVVVDSPGPSDMVTSPLQVTGKIAAFEAQFNIAIKDAGGNDIATAAGHSSEGQTLAPFSESISFSVSQETPACLWVFDFSAQDGQPSMVHQVPIILEP